MSSLTSDLDRFLKSDGIRILIDSEGVKAEPLNPLSEEDIEGFASMDPDTMSEDELETLQYRLEDLRDDMEDREPKDRTGEAYRTWDARLSAVEDFLDRVLDRLEELEESEDAGTGTGQKTQQNRRPPEEPFAR